MKTLDADMIIARATPVAQPFIRPILPFIRTIRFRPYSDRSRTRKEATEPA
jgi:hypothetical protein